MIQPAVGVVFDHTALLRLGRGHPFLSGLVSAPSHRKGNRHIYVPALCLAAAVVARPELGEHVLALPAVDVVGLDIGHALTVGRLISDQFPWELAHALAVCQPDAEWPTGRPVITATPEPYEGRHIAVVVVD